MDFFGKLFQVLESFVITDRKWVINVILQFDEWQLQAWLLFQWVWLNTLYTSVYHVREKWISYSCDLQMKQDDNTNLEDSR